MQRFFLNPEFFLSPLNALKLISPSSKIDYLKLYKNNFTWLKFSNCKSSAFLKKVFYYYLCKIKNWISINWWSQILITAKIQKRQTSIITVKNINTPNVNCQKYKFKITCQKCQTLNTINK